MTTTTLDHTPTRCIAAGAFGPAFGSVPELEAQTLLSLPDLTTRERRLVETLLGLYREADRIRETPYQSRPACEAMRPLQGRVA